MRNCTKCSLIKPLDEFYDDPRGKFGKRSVCKTCWRATPRQRNYAAERESNKRYREANPDKVREWQRRDYWKHREKRIASAKKFREENWDKAYAAIRRWKLENRERVLELDAAYRERNRERLAAKHAAYKKANPDKLRAQEQRRRARKSGAVGASYTTDARIHQRWILYGGRCYYCGGEATSIDHRIPLVRGGSHWPANLVPACQSCNSRKHDKTEREFRAFYAPS